MSAMALYLRVVGLSLCEIVDSTQQDGLARRLRTLVNYLKNRNSFKILSNSRSDTIPIISQFGVDVESWIELNLFAEWLKFPDFGRNARQSTWLKNIGGQCGFEMKDCPFYIDFSSNRIPRWVLHYALLDDGRYSVCRYCLHVISYVYNVRTFDYRLNRDFKEEAEIVWRFQKRMMARDYNQLTYEQMAPFLEYLKEENYIQLWLKQWITENIYILLLVFISLVIYICKFR